VYSPELESVPMVGLKVQTTLGSKGAVPDTVAESCRVCPWIRFQQGEGTPAGQVTLPGPVMLMAEGCANAGPAAGASAIKMRNTSLDWREQTLNFRGTDTCLY
jgi:hypothetical protein